MISIAVNEGYSMTQADVVAAFQNSPIDYVVHVKPPAGYDCPPGTLWQLCKSLYGLNTAAKDWYGEINDIFNSAYLKRLVTDACIFTNTDRSLVSVCLCRRYVDILAK